MDRLDTASSRGCILPFQSRIFLDLVAEDGLLVMARGLGLERIFVNLLRLYCNPSSLVVVLNASKEEQQFAFDELAFESVRRPLPVFTKRVGSVCPECFVG
jgi:DNA excision repair protein ERCC-4